MKFWRQGIDLARSIYTIVYYTEGGGRFVLREVRWITKVLVARVTEKQLIIRARLSESRKARLEPQRNQK